MSHRQTQSEIRTVRDQLTRLISLVRRSFRHFAKAVVIMIIGGSLAVGVALIKKRRYKSETVVLYRQIIHSSFIAGSSTIPTSTSREIGLRLQELLLARPTLRKIIEEFNLLPDIVQKYGHVHAVDELRKKIDFRVGGGDTFHIAFTGPTPAIAQGVTARLADYLVEKDIQLRTEQAHLTVKFLEDEARRAQNLLQKKEKELAHFLAAHPEFAQETQVPGGDGIGMGKSVRANQKKRSGPAYTPAERALMRQRDRILAQLGKRPPSPTVTRDPKVLQAKREAEAELKDALSRLREQRRFKTNSHPDVKVAQLLVQQAKARLTRVTRALESSTKITPAQGLNKEQLKVELASINHRLSIYRAQRQGGYAIKQDQKTNRIVKLETQWTTLTRQVKEARDRYLALETRQFRAGLKVAAETGGKASQMQIIDPAYKPNRPIGIGRTMIVAAGLAVSFILASLVLLSLGLMDDRLYDRLDVERLKVVEVLVEVPRGKRGWMKKKSESAVVKVITPPGPTTGQV